MSRVKRKHWSAGRRTRISSRPFASIVPNMATLMAMSCGLTAIRMGVVNRFDMAVFFIVLAALFDMVDGRLARLLGNTSSMGAELDSLSDLVSFGVAPAMVVYLKHLHTMGDMGWAVVLFYVACVALRLARFNVIQSTVSSVPYFIGVPSTAGGFLVAWLCIVEVVWKVEVCSAYWVIHLVGVGVLMVSRIPTFAIKRMTIHPSYMRHTLLGMVVVMGVCYGKPWMIGFLLGVGYLVSIPIGAYWFRCRRRTSAQLAVVPEEEA